MTEKRFGIIKTKTYGLYVPVDKMGFYNFSSFESELDCIRVVNALNDLEEKSRENGKIASKYLEENEQLKTQLQNTSAQRDEFHRGVRENANRVGKLKKENEQLNKKLRIYKSDELETLNDLQRCYENAKKSMKRIDVLEEENEQLKQEVTHWKKILDNHQQIVAKTLREQYHWLKNEDKIQNNDKTVALLELESISERLGIDLN